MAATTAWLAGTILAAYLLGSVSPSYLLGKRLRGIDLRRRGSGNLGSANALGVLGGSAAAAVLVLDLGKGALAAGALPLLLPEAAVAMLPVGLPQAVAAGGVVLGHCFSPWFGFRGGKGVATTLGAVLALDPAAAAAAALAFAAVVVSTRLVAPASLVAVALAAVVLAVRGAPRTAVLFALLAAVLVHLLHRSNLDRMRRGEEGAIFEESPPPEP